MIKSTLTADEQKQWFHYSSFPQAGVEVLLTAIANGAVWAIEPRYQRYGRLLYSIAYAVVTEHQGTQNLTQETFLAVWRHSSAYAQQVGAVVSWLLPILRHCTFDSPRSPPSLQLAGDQCERVEENEQPIVPGVLSEA